MMVQSNPLGMTKALMEEQPVAVVEVNLKKDKAPKEPMAKVSAPREPKAPTTHPSFLEMITDVITSLK